MTGLFRSDPTSSTSVRLFLLAVSRFSRFLSFGLLCDQISLFISLCCPAAFMIHDLNQVSSESTVVFFPEFVSFVNNQWANFLSRPKCLQLCQYRKEHVQRKEPAVFYFEFILAALMLVDLVSIPFDSDFSLCQPDPKPISQLSEASWSIGLLSRFKAAHPIKGFGSAFWFQLGVTNWFGQGLWIRVWKHLRC